MTARRASRPRHDVGLCSWCSVANAGWTDLHTYSRDVNGSYSRVATSTLSCVPLMTAYALQHHLHSAERHCCRRGMHMAPKESCTCSASRTADSKLQPGTVLSAWPKIRRLASEHISGNHFSDDIGYIGMYSCVSLGHWDDCSCRQQESAGCTCGHHPARHRHASIGWFMHISLSTGEQLAQLHHGVRAGAKSAQACENHGRDLPLLAAAAAWPAGAHQVHHLLREAAQGVSNNRCRIIMSLCRGLITGQQQVMGCGGCSAMRSPTESRLGCVCNHVHIRQPAGSTTPRIRTSQPCTR